MGLKGSVETFPLVSILQLIFNDRKTGTLRVTHGELEVSVIIREGSIVYAMSSKKEARLGRLLLAKGVITLKQLEQCLDLGRERKQALGKVLVDEGLVADEQLEEFVRKQVEGVLFELFFWETGEFEYNDTQLDLSRMVVTELNIMNLVMEASRRIDELSVLKKHIPSTKTVFEISPKGRERGNIQLAEDEGKIFAEIDGKRSVQELLDMELDDEFTVYKVLNSLKSSGLILKVGIPKPKPVVTEPDYFSNIVAGYGEVLQRITKFLEPELGNNTLDILSKSKPEVNPFQKGLFDNYHPNNKTETNTYVLKEHLRSIKDRTVAQAVLADAFNSLVYNILIRTSEELGKESAQTLAQDISGALESLSGYQIAPAGKVGLTEHLKKLITKAESNFKDKKKKE